MLLLWLTETHAECVLYYGIIIHGSYICMWPGHKIQSISMLLLCVPRPITYYNIIHVYNIKMDE